MTRMFSLEEVKQYVHKLTKENKNKYDKKKNTSYKQKTA